MYAQFTEMGSEWVYKMWLCSLCSGITTITHATLTHPSTPKRQNQKRPWGWVFPSTFIQCTSLPVQPVQRLSNDRPEQLGQLDLGLWWGIEVFSFLGWNKKTLRCKGMCCNVELTVMLGRWSWWADRQTRHQILEKGVDALKIDTQSTGFFLTAIRSRHLYNKASEWPKLRVHEDLFVLSRRRQDGG